MPALEGTAMKSVIVGVLGSYVGTFKEAIREVSSWDVRVVRALPDLGVIEAAVDADRLEEILGKTVDGLVIDAGRESSPAGQGPGL
jgi:hypothetical protein